jgi:hypothetical protein
MSHYSQYKGQSVGRVLHALETYCPFPHMVDQFQVGDGKVIIWSKDFATYVWEGDTPVFTFLPCPEDERDRRGWESRKHTAEENQKIMRPFLDDLQALFFIRYVVQEIRKALTFDEALKIRHVRDVLKDWADTICLDKLLRDRVVMIAKSASHNAKPHEWYVENIKHLCCGAIVSI